MSVQSLSVVVVWVCSLSIGACCALDAEPSKAGSNTSRPSASTKASASPPVTLECENDKELINCTITNVDGFAGSVCWDLTIKCSNGQEYTQKAMCEKLEATDLAGGPTFNFKRMTDGGSCDEVKEVIVSNIKYKSS